ncbi:aldo/keto reductase [Salinicoccus albus]|uniref:aldo/keto reductase n=1 Tax=Salinicoccus albus TaxID=418756 RepID=UPI0003616E49|nr:aldo/keto reductase [Salinicoccus albus]
MNYLEIKDIPPVSEFSLGCMNLPIDDPAETEKIIAFALESGINYFDTADFYQFGENEKVVGEILNKYRSRYNFTIGTKVGNEFDAAKKEKIAWNPTAPYIKSAVKDSLSRLGVDQIDLYQLHGGMIEDDKDETIQAFDELKQEGTIKAYGISSIRMNVIDYYQKHSSIATLMMQFNPIDNRPAEMLKDLDDSIRLLSRGPVMQGLLSDKSDEVLERKFKAGLLDYTHHELNQSVEGLAALNDDLTALSYRFLRAHHSVIVNGVSSFEQLKANLQSYNRIEDISQKSYEDIFNKIKPIKYGAHRL